MPRDGAIIFSDLIGKLDAFRVEVHCTTGTEEGRWIPAEWKLLAMAC